MRVLITYEKKFKHTGWAIGECVHCGQFEAAQARDVLRVVTVYFVPVWRSVVGRDNLCDFCERPLDATRVTEQTVGKTRWQPEDGLPALAQQLGIRQKFEQPATSDVRLDSLLSSVEAASSLTNIDLTTGLPGLIVGALGGAGLGNLAGRLAFEMKYPFGPNRDASSSLGGLVCGLVGTLIGGAVYAWLVRHQAARTRLMAACRRYHLDGRRLHELAQHYSERVREAARACRDECDADAP